jgi:hypothetical protein
MSLDLSRSTRWFLCGVMIVGLSIISAIALAAAGFLTTARWIGSRSLDVHVTVFDVRTGAPIPNAALTLFEGPTEGSTQSLAAAIQRSDGLQQTEVTSEEGTVVFTQTFVATGSTSRFDHSGNVRLSGWWVTIQTPDHSTVVMPLVPASHQRDLHDQSPVVISVGLSHSRL